MIHGLSKKQFAVLGALANSAFAFVSVDEREKIAEEIAEERGAEDPFACPAIVCRTAVFNTWRRREIAKALEFKRLPVPPCSFKDLTQEDYNDVLAHFRFLSGDAEGAVAAKFADGGNDCRQILANIEKSCNERGLMFPNYPEAICLRQYRCRLSAASLQDLRKILFTVRSRRRKKTETDFEKKRYDHSVSSLN